MKIVSHHRKPLPIAAAAAFLIAGLSIAGTGMTRVASPELRFAVSFPAER